MRIVTLESWMVVELRRGSISIKKCPPFGFIHVSQPTGSFALLEEGKTYEGKGVIEEGSLFLDQGWRRVLLGRVAD